MDKKSERQTEYTVEACQAADGQPFVQFNLENIGKMCLRLDEAHALAVRLHMAARVAEAGGEGLVCLPEDLVAPCDE